MLGADFFQQRLQAGGFFSDVLVMSVLDVRDEVGQRLDLPIPVTLLNVRCLFGDVQRIQNCR